MRATEEILRWSGRFLEKLRLELIPKGPTFLAVRQAEKGAGGGEYSRQRKWSMSRWRSDKASAGLGTDGAQGRVRNGPEDELSEGLARCAQGFEGNLTLGGCRAIVLQQWGDTLRKTRLAPCSNPRGPGGRRAGRQWRRLQRLRRGSKVMCQTQNAQGLVREKKCRRREMKMALRTSAAEA